MRQKSQGVLRALADAFAGGAAAADRQPRLELVVAAVGDVAFRIEEREQPLLLVGFQERVIIPRPR